MLEKTMIKTLAKHYKGGDFCIEFWDKERECVLGRENLNFA